MSKNIKEIGKELMGKSLNSFHRKTGLTQLEKNNEMQDGILNGILSQVDDAYIEKTEQSNVIHLEGSGDGVVVLDSVEGNTMVNLCVDKTEHINKNYTSSFLTKAIKHNTEYTVAFELFNITQGSANRIGVSIENAPAYEMNFANFTNGFHKVKVVTRGNNEPSRPSLDLNENVYACFWIPVSANGLYSIKNVVVLEGDWTEKEIPYFEGLQSSFEEKVNDDGKHEIEILSNNKNLFDIDKLTYTNTNITKLIKNKEKGRVEITYKDGAGYPYAYYYLNENDVKLLRGKRIIISRNLIQGDNTLNHSIQIHSTNEDGTIKWVTSGTTIPSNAKTLKIQVHGHNSVGGDNVKGNTTIYENIYIGLEELKGDYIPYKQNKIKLLLNEPLRAVNNTKDRLCIKDNKLVVERNIYSQEISPNIGYIPFIKNNHLVFAITPRLTPKGVYGMCNMFATDNNGWQYIQSEKSDNREFCQFYSNFNYIHIKKSRLSSSDAQGVNEWLLGNKVVLVYPLEEPYYEEVLNEYGEPILLEGYENGTLYIDSTIIPTTTVKYTPKMESLNTLKEVYNNNVMLTSDVNDNIIPYMMEVDLMIMEKEMALPSQINIRKMEVLDMTSMQKRTQDMLERLIKGKSLTEQECKTRVTTYLHAGKITDEQAEELMLLIDEVYA